MQMEAKITNKCLVYKVEFRGHNATVSMSDDGLRVAGLPMPDALALLRDMESELLGTDKASSAAGELKVPASSSVTRATAISVAEPVTASDAVPASPSVTVVPPSDTQRAARVEYTNGNGALPPDVAKAEVLRPVFSYLDGKGIRDIDLIVKECELLREHGVPVLTRLGEGLERRVRKAYATFAESRES
jgi:hypothetical protein